MKEDILKRLLSEEVLPTLRALSEQAYRMRNPQQILRHTDLMRAIERWIRTK